jgi:pimeloyl-ACP methyl ester carboxylesterase
MVSPAFESRFARHGDVRLHYVVTGSGPLVLLLHGIPDFWNGWRYQIGALAAHYRVAAMDLRGFNLSDKPTGFGAYLLGELMCDVLAVVGALGGGPVTLVGHDWGGVLAWWVAMLHPTSVERLAVLAAPHPVSYFRAREAGALRYRELFMEQLVAAPPGAPYDPERLSAWVSDESARMELLDALRRSDPEGIRNYYRANVPAPGARIGAVPSITAPVLALYGVDDPFIPAQYHHDGLQYAAGAREIVAIPGAGHFIHHEAAERVTQELLRWLGSGRDGPLAGR